MNRNPLLFVGWLDFDQNHDQNIQHVFYEYFRFARFKIIVLTPQTTTVRHHPFKTIGALHCFLKQEVEEFETIVHYLCLACVYGCSE